MYSVADKCAFLNAMNRVQDDVVKSLCLHQPSILISSFNRPNISYEGLCHSILSSSLSEGYLSYAEALTGQLALYSLTHTSHSLRALLA